jgi:hypothetical protein
MATTFTRGLPALAMQRHREAAFAAVAIHDTNQ